MRGEGEASGTRVGREKPPGRDPRTSRVGLERGPGTGVHKKYGFHFASFSTLSMSDPFGLSAPRTHGIVNHEAPRDDAMKK